MTDFEAGWMFCVQCGFKQPANGNEDGVCHRCVRGAREMTYDVETAKRLKDEVVAESEPTDCPDGIILKRFGCFGEKCEADIIRLKTGEVVIYVWEGKSAMDEVYTDALRIPLDELDEFWEVLGVREV